MIDVYDGSPRRLAYHFLIVIVVVDVAVVVKVQLINQWMNKQTTGK